ncbi:hypothetical protein HBN50_08045 [Halobacteriovorax sp. GB3]|uniref:hypothetical protein n=1 Tax=Halobacteriovorax sp. GB3 TaxID=2719615 RepID=UPI00235EE2B7|nr:hypothetical protein [Halobacteriovorax sp. GB3]MDD0853043.1 hypothetical protein [Halobacteriovorax sp. GB3]
MKQVIIWVTLILSFNIFADVSLREGTVAVQKISIYSSLPEYNIASVFSGKYEMPEAYGSLTYGSEVTILESYSLKVNNGKNIYYKVLYKGTEVTMTGYIFSHNITNSGTITRTNVSLH